MKINYVFSKEINNKSTNTLVKTPNNSNNYYYHKRPCAWHNGDNN